MKAAVLHGANDIRVETIADPVIEPDGIIIKVRTCGICGSDLHVYKQEGKEGTVFGHEFAGDVAEVGSQVKDITAGDRVTAVGFRPCGQCFWCLQGKTYRCSNMALVGYQLPGAMAEYVPIPAAVLDRNVFKLPEALSYRDGATVEPLSISLYAVKRAQPRENDTAVVLGAGIIGLCVVQVLKAVGVTKVLISGRRSSRLKAAQACGADLVVDAAAVDALPVVMEATSGMGADLVVECAGTQETFDQAVEMAHGSGKIMLVGVYEKPLNWDPLKVISKNLTLVGCLGGNFPGAIELLQNGKVNTKPLVTHSFPLEQAQSAFQTQLKDRQAIKVMIRP